MSRLTAAARPCSTCPYRKDTPPGVWHPDEYRKLPTYDDAAEDVQVGVFLCHLTNAEAEDRTLVCRGWLTVASESVAVRLAVLRRDVTSEQIYAEVDIDLYATGAEACAAGMAGVEAPSVEAVDAARRLVRRGVSSYEDNVRAEGAD